MRFVTLFSGMMMVGIVFLGVLWSVGLGPSELYRIALESTGIVSLACKFMLICIPGVPLSLVLTALMLQFHRSFPSLDRWVDSVYLNTKLLDRFFLHIDSVIEGSEEIGNGFRRIRRHHSVDEVLLGISQVLHGVMAAAFLVFIFVGTFLVLYHYA